MTSDISMELHTQAVNGIQLHYATWGRFSNPARCALLVHGLTNNHLVWSAFGPLLASQGWYVIAPDLRGRGWSSTPAHGVGIPYHTNDLLALCDALGLSRVHYIGHSLGALIGYFFAAVHPQRLDRFVAIDAGGRPSPHIMQILRPVLERLGHIYPSLDAYLHTIRQESSSVVPWDDGWEQYYRSDTAIRRDGTLTTRTAQAAIEEELIVNACINYDVIFPVIKAPTLILRADQGTYQPDWFVLPPEESERVHSLITGSQLVVIPDGNHYTIIHSEIFTRAVLDFLTSPAPARG